MTDGFLSRWSRRKLDTKEGKALPPEPAASAASAASAEAAAQPSPQPSPAGRGSEDKTSRGEVDHAKAPSSPGGEGGGEGQTSPPPTLDDVAALTPESDFTRFAASDVSPEVKNAALRKLFADPRYNVQDGLDVYIGDYSQPDPIPESMLRKLASAQFLKLFDEPDEKKSTAPDESAPRDVADNPTAQSVAHSGEHADPDLRLQQDDAAPGTDPGRGAG